MILRSIQPLTEISTRDISWGWGGVGLTTLPLSFADCLEILGASTSCSSNDLPRPVQGLLYPYDSYMVDCKSGAWAVIL
jgi:hypothetical protein